MHYLVISKKHGLFPLAHWLRQEGQSVICTSLKPPYARRAWRGIATTHSARKFEQPITEWLKAVVPAETILITDCARLTNEAQPMGFAQILGTIHTPRTATRAGVRLGGWWQDGVPTAAHWVFVDWGVAYGGQGPALEAGFTIAFGHPPAVLLEAHKDALGAYRGPVQLDLAWDAEASGWRSGSLRAGWGMAPLLALQTQPKVLPVLETGIIIVPRFTVGVVAHVPPYPFTASACMPVPLAASPQIPMDVAKGKAALESGNLDGLLGLCVGTGNTFEHARSLAFQNATSLQAPCGTWRLDVGAQVPAALSQLETLGWF